MKTTGAIFLAAGLVSLPAGAAPVGDLFQAAASGRTEAISRAVLGGADVNAANQNGWTPLMVASARGDLAAVSLLLAYGAEPGAAARTGDVSGFTALMSASYHGHPEVAAALLREGAEPDTADNHYYGETALILAVKRGSLDCVRVLLAAGADANAASRGGVTPLMYAASYGRPEIINLLLDSGADVSARDDESLDALNWAFLSGSRRAAVRALLRSAGE